MNDVICHYDLLIDEGNDPVHDSAELKAYMDLWDGETFLNVLALDGTQSVLEIGVGTGRLAIRTAPMCRQFTGIDVSPKTIARARENLSDYPNVSLLCGDFMAADFPQPFDVIYASLTFMHIPQKVKAIAKITDLLAPGGRVILSLDKNQDEFIEYGTRKVRVYPDKPDDFGARMKAAGLNVYALSETEFAHIIAAEKQ